MLKYIYCKYEMVRLRMKNIEVQKTILSNGLSVITACRDSDIFSLGMGIKAGSLYEDKDNNGIAHMVEHMLFKGTINRNMDRLNDDIERLAGDIDIYTTYGSTVLTADVMKEKGEECLEIISDMMMNSIFPEREFRLEKKVIIEEIKMDKDDPEEQSYLGLFKAAFPESWHKYYIAGTIKSVKGIKINMLKEFYRNYYVPKNAAICVVSSYSHDEVVNMVEKYFGKWVGKEAPVLAEGKYAINPRRVVRHRKGLSQTHLIYAFDIQSLSRREEVALTLLNEKIGAGANSILFKELRDKRGYAYSVYSSIDFIKNLKMFYIYAGISEENLKDTMNVIEKVIDNCKKNELGINEESIKTIKDMFFTHMAIALESSSHMVEYLLDGEINYENPLNFQEVLEMMNSINVEDIKGVIEKVFKEPLIHILLPA